MTGGLQKEAEGNQKFAFWQPDVRELLVSAINAIEISLLKFTSVKSHLIFPLTCFLDFVDSLTQGPNCLLETIRFADFPIFAEQNNLFDRLEEWRVDLHLDLQKHLISNLLGGKASRDIRVGSLQCLDERIGPNDLKFHIPDHILNPVGDVNGCDADLPFCEDIDLHVIAIDFEDLRGFGSLHILW